MDRSRSLFPLFKKKNLFIFLLLTEMVVASLEDMHTCLLVLMAPPTL